MSQLQKIEIIIILILSAIIGVLSYKLYQKDRIYDIDIKRINEVCDSIKTNEEFIIDSLCQEIDVKESVIDSLFSVRAEIIREKVIIKEEILKLPLDETVELLRDNIDYYYEFD